MIQRIQSVFLFLVAAIMVTVLFLPIWNKLDLDAQEKVTLNAFKMVYSLSLIHI